MIDFGNFWKNNDNYIELTLFDEVDEVYINDAVATVTVTDIKGGVIVNGQAMPYVSGSNGEYATVIDAAVFIPDRFVMEITASTPSGFDYYSRQDAVKNKQRGFNDY